MSRRRSPARAGTKVAKPGGQLDIDQRCRACRMDAHRACVTKTCPCAERDHK